MSAVPNQAPQASPVNATGQDAFLQADGRDENFVSLGEATAGVVERLRTARLFQPTVTTLVDFERRDLPTAETCENPFGTPRLWSVRVGTSGGQSVHFIGYSREHAERIAAAFEWRPAATAP